MLTPNNLMLITKGHCRMTFLNSFSTCMQSLGSIAYLSVAILGIEKLNHESCCQVSSVIECIYGYMI